MTVNKLKNQRVYLAGAMDRVPDRGAGWRADITPFLKSMGAVVFNPLNKPTEMGKEDEQTHLQKCRLKEEGRYDELSALMRVIRATDLRLVDISDFMVVNLDINTHPCGTLEEIFLANRSKKPVIVHIEQGKENAPDWLFGTLPHSMFFSKWDDVRDYLSRINGSQDMDDCGRWRFFAV